MPVPGSSLFDGPRRNDQVGHFVAQARLRLIITNPTAECTNRDGVLDIEAGRAHRDRELVAPGEACSLEQIVSLTHVTDAEWIGDPGDGLSLAGFDEHTTVGVLMRLLDDVENALEVSGLHLSVRRVELRVSREGRSEDLVDQVAERCSEVVPDRRLRVELRIERSQHPIVALVQIEVAWRGLRCPIGLLDHAAQPLAKGVALVFQDAASLRTISDRKVVGHVLPAIAWTAQEPIEDGQPTQFVAPFS